MIVIPYVVSGFSRTVTVRLKADTTYICDGPPEGGHYVPFEM